MKRRYGLLSLLAMALVLALAPRTAKAAVYTWTDERGVVHMTDRKPEKGGPRIEVYQEGGGQSSTGPGTRDKAIRTMLDTARARPAFADLQRIVEEYRRSHSYSMSDYFVCLDMALEMANILKTRKFSPRIVAGSTKADIAGMERSRLLEVLDHAWVVVELERGVQVALEATGGFVADERVPHFEYYYQGVVFESPGQARETSILIRNANDNCRAAGDLVREWNARYAGSQPSAQALEAKGRVTSKMGECKEHRAAYEDLIRRQYRPLY